MAYRRYKAKTFAQKVRSNKSLKWCKDQNERLTSELSEARIRLNSLREFSDLFLIPTLVAREKLIVQLRNEEIQRHAKARPNGFLVNIFQNEALAAWKLESNRLRQLPSPKALKRSHEMTDFIHQRGLTDLVDTFTGDVMSARDMKSRLDRQIKDVETAIHWTSVHLEILAPKLKRLTEAERKKQSDRSVIAKVKKTSRENAARVKQILEQTALCPYCEGDLGENPHADHIYPLNKGGQETETNMVLVCAACNLSKSDKTLFEFCADKGFSFDEVSDRLRNELGKDF